ncbi:MAG: S1C family serine protease [Acidimicrobiales bacterium]
MITYRPPDEEAPGGPGHVSPGGYRKLVSAAAALSVAGLGAGIAIGYGAFSGVTTTTTSTTATAVSAVGAGLVDINTVLGYQTARAAGTGMVLTSTGEILTNNHVIEGATNISVTDVGNGRTYRANVVGYDASADVAVLELVGASGLPTVPIGSSSNVSVGESVIALGNAGGTGGTPKVAGGTVTALDQAITAGDQGSARVEHLTGLIQTNVGIQPGDSGGSLIDPSGQVVGMNTAASSSNGLVSNTAAARAYAIPIDTAISIAHSIENGTTSSAIHLGSTAFLGVEVATASGPGGAQVAGVVSGSPATSAGLTAGDVITSVNGTTITSATGLSAIMGQLPAGSDVSVSWTTTPGRSASAQVHLGTGPAG